MTEEHVRRCVLVTVSNVITRVSPDQGCSPALRIELIDDAEQAIMPAVADLVQQALEDGFDGRACRNTVLPQTADRVGASFWRGLLLGVAASVVLWAIVILLTVMAVRAM